MTSQQIHTRAEWPICFILFVVFLVLKLTETIGWSWWWVTAPLWVPFVAGLVAVLVVGSIVLLVKILSK